MILKRGEAQSEAAFIGLAVLVLGGILDAFVIGPFYHASTIGTQTTGWNPATVFMFFTGLPYATSVAIAAVAVAGIFGRQRR